MTVVIAVHPDSARLTAAVDAQVRPPDATLAPDEDPRRAGADWVWLLSGAAVPQPDTLRALLNAADRCAAAGVDPRLLSSWIVDRDGTSAEGHVPVAPQGQMAVTVQTVGLRVLPVRSVTAASVLVAPDVLGATRARPAPGRELVWSASHLRGGGGFLVPDSVAEAVTTRPGLRERAGVSWALVASNEFSARERLRHLGEVVEHVSQLRFR